MSNNVALNLLAEDNDTIPYRKSLRRIAGSVTATILLQQIVWRAKHHKWEAFYKFKSPCKHELYREGDSWTEELGFSIEEFDAAIKRIGTKITQGTKKTDVLAGDTPNSLVLYWTDTNRITWYQLNVDLLGKWLNAIYLEDGKTPFTQKEVKPLLPFLLPENTTETTTESSAATQRERAQSSTKEILAQYVELKQQHEPGAVINYPKESKAAKSLAQAGWSAALVVECGKILYAEPFYRDKPLSLAVIASQIAAKMKRPAAPGTADDNWVIITNQYEGTKYLQNLKTGERREYVNS
jgi:hypothetical protein